MSAATDAVRAAVKTTDSYAPIRAGLLLEACRQVPDDKLSAAYLRDFGKTADERLMHVPVAHLTQLLAAIDAQSPVAPPAVDSLPVIQTTA